MGARSLQLMLGLAAPMTVWASGSCGKEASLQHSSETFQSPLQPHTDAGAWLRQRMDLEAKGAARADNMRLGATSCHMVAM